MKKFSHFSPKNKKSQEDLTRNEFMFLMAAYDYVEDQTSCLATSSDVRERLLLQMGKYFALLREARKG